MDTRGGGGGGDSLRGFMSRACAFRARSLLRAGFVLASMLVVAMSAAAQTSPIRVSADYGRIFHGLEEGDHFRVLFVTSESYPAWNTNIAYYNGVIQDLVRRRGHGEIRKHASHFKAVGQTQDDSVWDNAAMWRWDVEAPIYWVGSPSKVADDYSDFYDGSWQNEGDPRDESGTRTVPHVLGYYTGIPYASLDADWRDLFRQNQRGTYWLGGVQATRKSGLGGEKTTSWVDCGYLHNRYHSPLSTTDWPCESFRNGDWVKRPLYGISPVLVVGSPRAVTFAQQHYEFSEGADRTSPPPIELRVPDADHFGGSIEVCPSPSLDLNRLRVADSIRLAPAVLGTDYDVAGSRSATSPKCTVVRFPAGSGAVTANPVHAVQNDVDDRDRVFRMHLQNATGDVRAPRLGRDTAWLIIRDDDPTVVTLTSDVIGAIQEGGVGRQRETSFKVTLSRKLYGSSDRIDVPIRISGDVTLKDVALRTDSTTVVMQQPFHQVLVREGGRWRHRYYEGKLSFFWSSQSATVFVTAVDDDEDEGDELMAVELGSKADFARQKRTHVGGGAIPDPNSGRVIIRINDNDGDPPDRPARPVLVTLHPGRFGWVEGKAGTATLGVSISRTLAPGERIDVPLALSSTTGAQLTGSKSVIKRIALASTANGVSLADAKTAMPKLTFQGPSRSSRGASATWGYVRLTHNEALTDDDLTPETVEVRLGDLGGAGLGTDVVGTVAPSDDGDPDTRDNLVTIVIADNGDQPTATLSPASSSVYEGEEAVLTVTLSKAWSVDRSYRWYTKPVSGDQPDASDYAAVPKASANDVTVAAGKTTAALTVRTLEDKERETSEVFHVGLLEGSKETGAAKVTIVDASDRLIVEPTALTVKEADDGGTPAREHEASYRIRLAAAPPSDVLYVRVNAKARDAGVARVTDRRRALNTKSLIFTVRNWSEWQTVTVRGVNDKMDNAGNKRETQITHTVHRWRGGGWQLDPSVFPVVVITVEDDDAAPSGITLTASPDRLAEDGGAKTVTVTAAVTGGTTYGEDKTVTVAVGRDGDTAVEGTDYETVADRTVTIKAGASSAAALTFSLTPKNDDVDEADETISVTGTSGTLAVTGDEITITDDDPLPKISIISVVSPNESNPGSTEDNSIRFRFGLDRPSAKPVSFFYDISDPGVNDSDAVEGEDYLWSSLTSKISGGTILPGNTSSLWYSVTVLRDTMYELDERVRITLKKAENAVFGDRVTAIAQIKNDDRIPRVASIMDAVVEEGGTARFPVTLTNASYQSFRLLWSAGGSEGTTATPHVDFKYVNKASFYPDPVSTSFTLEVETIQDDIAEGLETFVLLISSHGGKATGTIVDDESAHVRIDDATVVEGGKAAFKVWLTKAVEKPVTVSWQTRDDAAGSSPASGSDYTATGSPLPTVSFAAGQTSATIEVQTTDDVLVEPAETFRVSLRATTDSLVPVSPTHGEAVGKITDDDDAPDVTLEVDTDPGAAGEQDSVKEDAGATKVAVTARLAGTSRFVEAKTVDVTVGKAGDGAKSGSDYVPVPSFRIAIAAGQAAGKATFTLTPKKDDVVEGSESLSVDGKLSGVTVTGDTITITDVTRPSTSGLVQGPPRIDLSARPDSVAEDAGGTAIKVTATLAGQIRFAKPVAVTVAVGASGDTATEGTDYGTVGSFTIEIPGEQAVGSGTFTLTPTDDAVSEGDEKLSVTGTAVAIDVTGAEVTIEDDEALPEVSLVLTPATIPESAPGNTSTVTAKLSAESSEAVTLEVADRPIGSGGLLNYTVSANRKLTIGAGALNSAGTVTIDAKENLTDSNDTVVVVTAGASGGNGVVDPLPAALVIKDDDTRSVKVSASRLVVAEAPDPDPEDGEQQLDEATYTVVLGTVPTGPVTIEVESGDVSAAVVSPTRLTFARNTWSSTQTVTVSGVDDDKVNAEGVRAVEVTHTVSADDTDYEDETAPSLAVGVMDDDREPDEVSLYVDTGGLVRNVVAEDAGETRVSVIAGIPGVSRFEVAKSVTVKVGKAGDSAEEGPTTGRSATS